MDKTLIVIFNPSLNSKVMKTQCVALAKLEGNVMKIISGFYKGFEVDDFNRIMFYDTDNPFIIESGENKGLSNKAGLIHNYDSSTEFVYIFKASYIAF